MPFVQCCLHFKRKFHSLLQLTLTSLNPRPIYNGTFSMLKCFCNIFSIYFVWRSDLYKTILRIFIIPRATPCQKPISSHKKKLILVYFTTRIVFMFTMETNESAQHPRVIYKLYKIWIEHKISIWIPFSKKFTKIFALSLPFHSVSVSSLNFILCFSIYSVLCVFVAFFPFHIVPCYKQHCLHRSHIYGIHHIYSVPQNNRSKDSKGAKRKRYYVL